jgi:hypothetical protein
MSSQTATASPPSIIHRNSSNAIRIFPTLVSRPFSMTLANQTHPEQELIIRNRLHYGRWRCRPVELWHLFGLTILDSLIVQSTEAIVPAHWMSVIGILQQANPTIPCAARSWVRKKCVLGIEPLPQMVHITNAHGGVS